MARFCTKCGSELGENGLCPRCSASGNGPINLDGFVFQDVYSNTNQSQQVQPQKSYSQNPTNKNYRDSAQKKASKMPKEASKYAKKAMNTIMSDDIKDMTSKDSNAYEKDKKIVPDCISPNDREIPIKQYQIAKLRNRILGITYSKAIGRLQVTNQRVIFRAPGKTVAGRTITQHEFSIDEIGGIEARNEYVFHIWDLIAALIIAAIGFGIILGTTMLFYDIVDGIVYDAYHSSYVNKLEKLREEYDREYGDFDWNSGKEYISFDEFCDIRGFDRSDNVYLRSSRVSTETSTILGLILGCACFVPIFFIKRGSKIALLKLIALGGSVGGFSVPFWLGSDLFFIGFIGIIPAIILLVELVINAIKPNLILQIKTKSALPAINISRIKLSPFGNSENIGYKEVLPEKDLFETVKEIGALIRDVQALGDHAVEKWTESN